MKVKLKYWGGFSGEFSKPVYKIEYYTRLERIYKHNNIILFYSSFKFWYSFPSSLGPFKREYLICG